jgi:hypothetical protein
MYYPLVTKSINFKDQPVTQNQIIKALKVCYENTCFSTMPYIYDNYNSEEAIDYTNSGNCISLSLFLKKYLKQNYNINSTLIPASIPNMYKKEGYLPISHVALAIPKNKDEAFIADPAFYFREPILYDKKGNAGSVNSSNIYEDSMEELDFASKISTVDEQLHDLQKIPKKTPYCECNKKTNPDDSWKYYLREVVDPDKSIGMFYVNLQKPFISTTRLDSNNQCHMDKYVKIDGDDIVIKERNKELYNGPKNNIPPQLIAKLNSTIYPFLKENIEDMILKNI